MPAEIIARMGFYARHILPHILDLALRNKESARLRADWIPQARGDVVEIGVGSGLNLPFYSSSVRRVYGVDPSSELQRMARKRATDGIPVKFLLQSAEQPLPLADTSIDTVVVTWTLCSIPNPVAALQGVKRVLRPDGHLIFVEHGLAPDSSVAAWQERITPLWKHITGGCHLNRKIDKLIAGTGFRIAELKTGYTQGPRAMTYTYQGFAQIEH